MKTKFLIFVLFAFIFSSSLTSCKKKEIEKERNLEPTAKELISRGIWNYYLIETYDSSGNLRASNSLNYREEYTVSNNFYMYEDSSHLIYYGTYTIDEGSDPMILKLTIYSTGGSSGGQLVQGEILKLSETEMEIKMNGSPFYYIKKYRR